MRIKLKYPDVETFIQKYAVNISRGGIFIATKQPKPVGTFVKFEFLLSDAGASSIIRGEGQVQWTKEYDPAHPMKAHGMGVKFSRLDADSQTVIDRALRWRAEHGTNPGAPLPVPTSSAHTIHTRGDSQAEVSPPQESYERSQSSGGRTPQRERERERPSRSAPPPEAPIETFASPTEETTTPSMEPPVRAPDTNEPLPPMPPSRGETRPIAIDELPDERPGRPPNVETAPIALHLESAARPSDDIDALVSEWGLSEEKLKRILKRSRGRVGVEATAELERLLLKPPKLPTPSKAEALQQLAALLSKKNGKNGTH